MLDLSNASFIQRLFLPETDPPPTFYAGNQHVSHCSLHMTAFGGPMTRAYDPKAAYPLLARNL